MSIIKLGVVFTLDGVCLESFFAENAFSRIMGQSSTYVVRVSVTIFCLFTGEPQYLGKTR